MDVCRFCLSEDELKPLFSKLGEKNKQQFSKLLGEVTSTVVTPLDGLSMMICKDCLWSVRRYAEFRKQSRRSLRHLKKLFIKQVLQLEDKFIMEPNIDVNEGSETELEFALSDDFKSLLDHMDQSDVDSDCEDLFRKKLKYLKITDEIVNLELRYVKIKRNNDNTEILLSYLDKNVVDEEPNIYEDLNIMVVETTNGKDEVIVMDHCQDNQKRIKSNFCTKNQEKDSSVDKKDDASVDSDSIETIDPLTHSTQDEAEIIENIVIEEEPATTNDDKKYMTIVTEFPSTSSKPDMTEVKLKVLAGKELHKYVITGDGCPSAGTSENENNIKLSQKYDWKALAVNPPTGYPKTEIIQCCICFKNLKGYSSFYKHAMTHFPPEFICPECNRGFHEKRNMETHRIRKHGAAKPYLCTYCDYRACSKPELLIHERASHTGERPFQCDACGDKFYSLQCQRQHERKHLTVKMYHCESCSKAFKSQAEVTAHVRKTHKFKYRYLCYLCPREFSTHGSVRTHLTKIHDVPRKEQKAITHEVGHK